MQIKLHNNYDDINCNTEMTIIIEIIILNHQII